MSGNNRLDNSLDSLSHITKKLPCSGNMSTQLFAVGKPRESFILLKFPLIPTVNYNGLRAMEHMKYKGSRPNDKISPAKKMCISWNRFEISGRFSLKNKKQFGRVSFLQRKNDGSVIGKLHAESVRHINSHKT